MKRSSATAAPQKVELPSARALGGHGLRLRRTLTEETARWKKLKPQTRLHLSALCRTELITFLAVMTDLGFSVEQGYALKRYVLESEQETRV